VSTGLAVRRGSFAHHGERQRAKRAVDESKQAHIRFVVRQADDQVHVVRVGSLGRIRFRRCRRRARMLVIEADDIQSAAARDPASSDVIPRVDHKPRTRRAGDVTRGNAVDDDGTATEEHSAALGGRRLARVRDNRIDHRTVDFDSIIQAQPDYASRF